MGPTAGQAIARHPDINKVLLVDTCIVFFVNLFCASVACFGIYEGRFIIIIFICCNYSIYYSNPLIISNISYHKLLPTKHYHFHTHHSRIISIQPFQQLIANSTLIIASNNLLIARWLSQAPLRWASWWLRPQQAPISSGSASSWEARVLTLSSTMPTVSARVSSFNTS